MLDHEPDTNDTSSNDTSSHDTGSHDTGSAADATTSAGTGRPAAAPRRRRAATRQAGPPSVVPEASEPVQAAAQTEPTPAPAMTAETPPAGADGQPSVPDDQLPAKKTARKRATKSAEGGTRTPRKRATKKTAAAAEPAQLAEPAQPTESAQPTEPAAETAAPVIEPTTTEPAAAEPAGADPAGADVAVRAEDDPVADPDATRTQADEAQAERTTDQPETETEQTGAVPAEAVQAGTETPAPEVASEPTPEEAAAALDQLKLALSEDVSTSDDEADTDDDDTDDDVDDSESDDSESDDSDSDDSDDSDESGSPRRRRRRRGGRRRRRSGGADDRGETSGSTQSETNRSDTNQAETKQSGTNQTESTKGEPSGGSTASGQSEQRANAQSGNAQSGEAQSGEDADDSSEDAGDESGQRRRRRRRRRRGEDSAPSADDPAEVVVRVREPRSRKQAAQEVTGIEGSTRMEAKRQRRREGREAGRRRAPILSEAEFLARRESVVRKMIIRQREELSQIAVLEDDILVEHYVDRESAASLIGNVYLGRVQNVLPSMEAAFIDIGRGRNAVLYAGEVDWDAFGANGQQRKVENVLKSGQTVLVQVTKDPVGAKGARLTSHVTLPGRYIVYAPGGHLSGISRKLPDTERKRLKSVLNELVPESASVIVRTAAEGASEEELVRDVNRLKAQWEDIERKVKAGSAPKLLYGEPDLTVRIVRDLFTEDFAELIIQGNGSSTDAYEAVNSYVEHVAPHLHDRMRRWDVEAEGDLFARYRLDEQISKALERKVFLPSGGSLIIDRTEAMTVIDVNTGKFTGSGGNLEATVTSNNLEAAEEIVRQLRLRDIGGIIVIDFIDMVLPSNRELLLRRLVECLGRDRTRHQVAEVTSLGLVQMTRKKIGTGLLEAFTTECEHCHGRGYEISDVPVETQKQPDGGSRDHRGGGGGRDRGRGRGNQSHQGGGNNQGGGGNQGNGNPKQHHQPIPAALRPDHVSGAKASDEAAAASESPSDQQPGDQLAGDQAAAELAAGEQAPPDSVPEPESTPAS